MTERRVWIAQLLCGPNRHAIIATYQEADSREEAEREIGAPLWSHAERLLAGGTNAWCAICGAKRKSWRVEVGRSRFRTMEEAEEPMRRTQAENVLANALFGTHGSKPPIKH